MRKILSLVLSVLFLFSVVGCGSRQSEPSSEPEIEDPNAYLANLFHGIYKLEERDGAYGDPMIGGGAFIPMRFSAERIADYMNLSVGGEIYRAAALDEDVHFSPTHIIVALGTNDFYSNITPNMIKFNASSYLQEIKVIYPNIPVTVIAPFGNIPGEYYDAIKEAADPLGYDTIDGTTLISKNASSWNKDQVHPSSAGFNEITASLTPILQQKLG